MNVAVFTFNDFYENTYVLYDDSGECVIVDPGMNSSDEEQTLSTFVEVNNLKPVKLLNTHCHIDHVFGNAYVQDKYDLKLYAHAEELQVLQSFEVVAQMYGIPHRGAPKYSIDHHIEDGGTIEFGTTELNCLFTPGHSPGSISFLHSESKQIIAGDVLFKQSIGRTDLPGGDFDTLIRSIREKLLPLDNMVRVYSGHGDSTTIGDEANSNPFLIG